MRKPKKTIVKATALAAISASAALAATTPYDLIRPTWPLTWDEKAIDKFDTTVTKAKGVLNIDRTPASYKAGALMPDTLDQAYLDAINTKISPIRVNQAGYLKSDKERQFYFVGTAEEFEVVDENGKSLSPKVTGSFTDSGKKTASDWTIVAGRDASTSDHERYQVSFTGTSGQILVGKIPQSVPTDKRLRIKVNEEISSTFIVSENVYSMVKDAALKFFGIQRSGDSKSWFHGPSHTKDGSGKVVTGVKATAVEGISLKAGDLQGGWYDGGDHMKESQTQAFAFMTLAVMSATNPGKDVDHYAYNQVDFVNTDKIPDMLREAKHGADFFLRSYKAAKGIVDNMAVSVGNFASDHSWWGRPEIQDYVTLTNRGGAAERDVRLGELGSNVSGEIAAGLALVGKLYTKYDKDFADSCLTVAEKMYDFAKSLAQGKDSYDGDKPFVYNKVAAGWSSTSYNGNNEYFDDMALASVALLYATGKEEYLNDALRAKNLTSDQHYSGCTAGCFSGGWFVTSDYSFLKRSRNTSWDNSYTYALYALYKLILADKDKALNFGLTEDERLAAIEDCVANMIANLSDVSYSGASTSITLPKGMAITGNTVTFDPTWYTMTTLTDWLFNRYQIGNTFEVMAYADVAADIEKQGLSLPNMSSTGMKSSEMFQLGINQLNYMLGVNPWDVSFIYGVGDKNDNHPHHRAANPEGRNTLAFSYKYVRPVGGLYGGKTPDESNSIESDKLSWENYLQSDITLDASALLLSALTIASADYASGGDDYYEKKCDNCDTTTTRPFISDSVYATAYTYEFGDLETINLNIVNSTFHKIDSLVTYIYFEATEEDVDDCSVMLDSDICLAYDMAGFIHPCPNEDKIRTDMRKLPEKVDGTYNEKTKTYTWVKTIVLDSVAIGSSIRLDLGITAGTKVSGACESERSAAKVKVADGWSFTAHTASKNSPDYAGAPSWDKDQCDIQEAPMDPYVVLRSKGKLLWGYGPANETDERVGFRKIAVTPTATTKMVVEGRKLMVMAPAQGTKTLKIFDLLGNQLLAQSFEGTATQVSLAKLPRGAMIAKLSSNGKLLANKAFKLK